MPKELFPNPTYPSYLSGAGYVLSGDLVNPAVRVSQNVQYIPIEDTYIGMLMKTLGVSPKHDPRYTVKRMSKFNSNNHRCCFFSEVFVVYRESDEQLLTFWKFWDHFDLHQCSYFLRFYYKLKIKLS